MTPIYSTPFVQYDVLNKKLNARQAIEVRYSCDNNFPLNDAERYRRRDVRFLKRRAIKSGLHGEEALAKAHLTTDTFLPNGVLVVSEKNLTKWGDIVEGAYFPLLRGRMARAFESVDLGPDTRLVEVPVYEPEPDAGPEGPYRIRHREGEGAWLALIVESMQDTICDEKCDKRALYKVRPPEKGGTKWAPYYAVENPAGKWTRYGGLVFKPEALSGPLIWREKRDIDRWFHLAPPLGLRVAEVNETTARALALDHIVKNSVEEGGLL